MIGCFVKDGIIFILILYLQYTKGLNSIEAGATTSILIIIMLLTSPLAGKLSTNINAVTLSNIGLLLMIISTMLFCLINYIPNLNILIPIIFLGLGYGLFDTPNKKIILKNANESKLGHITAFLNTVRDGGIMIATVIFTLILSLLPNTNIPELYAQGSQIMFIIFFIATLSSLIMSLHFNKNLEIIYKINIKKIIKPLTTTVGERANIIYEVPDAVIKKANKVGEEVVDTVTDAPNQAYNKMTEVPDNVSNVIDDIHILKFIKNKK